MNNRNVTTVSFFRGVCLIIVAISGEKWALHGAVFVYLYSILKALKK